MQHFFLNSGVVAWINYSPPTRLLQVKLNSGGCFTFEDVSLDLVHRFIACPSAGDFLKDEIAGRHRGKKIAEVPLNVAQQVTLDAPNLAEQMASISLANVTPHLPAGWIDAMQWTLKHPPVLVQVVRSRKSKHGDHQLSGCRRYSKITVNASGNIWQFVVTLLHELAHAHVMHGPHRHAPPHGTEWKHAFRGLLRNHLSLFPPDLQPHVADYAQNPLFSSSAHPGLAAALRKHDTSDKRLTVEELPDGEKFSPDGELILIKGQRLRSWFRCTTPDGKKRYRVPPTARVHTVFRKEPG